MLYYEIKEAIKLLDDTIQEDLTYNLEIGKGNNGCRYIEDITQNTVTLGKINKMVNIRNYFKSLLKEADEEIKNMEGEE